MEQKLWLLALILCLAVLVGGASPSGSYKCSFSLGGSHYDLSPLKSHQQTVNYVDEKKKAYITYIAVCAALPVSMGSCKDSAACQTWTCNGIQCQKSMGSVSTVVAQALGGNYNGSSGVRLSFTGGDDGRSAEIDLICDASSSSFGTVKYINENPQLHYNWQWTTKYACPTKSSSKLSGGSILLIMVFVLVVVYFAAGAVFMKFIRHAEGIEIVPNVHFWTAIPGLTKDGVLFVVSKTCRRGSSYKAVDHL